MSFNIIESNKLLANINHNFSAWGKETVKSKVDQLIWVEAEQRFSLLGRDFIDFKLSNDWNTGICRVVYALSEIALCAARKISRLFYREAANPQLGYEKINEVATSCIKNIQQLDPLNVGSSDLQKLRNNVTIFSEGLDQIRPLSNPIKKEEIIISQLWNGANPGLCESKFKAEKTVKELNHAISSKIKEFEDLKNKSLNELQSFLPNKPFSSNVVSKSGYNYSTRKIDLDAVRSLILTAKKPSEMVNYFSDDVIKSLMLDSKKKIENYKEMTDQELISYFWDNEYRILDYYSELIGLESNIEKRIEKFCFYPPEVREKLLKDYKLNSEIKIQLVRFGANSNGIMVDRSGQAYILKGGEKQIIGSMDLDIVSNYIMKSFSREKVEHFKDDVLKKLSLKNNHTFQAKEILNKCEKEQLSPQETILSLIANGIDLSTGKHDLEQSLTFFINKSISTKYLSLETLQGILSLVPRLSKPLDETVMYCYNDAGQMDIAPGYNHSRSDWNNYDRNKRLRYDIKKVIERKKQELKQKNLETLLKTLYGDRYETLNQEQKEILAKKFS